MWSPVAARPSTANRKIEERRTRKEPYGVWARFSFAEGPAEVRNAAVKTAAVH